MNCEEINRYLTETPSSFTREVIRIAAVGLVDAHRALEAAGVKESPAGSALEQINSIIGGLRGERAVR